MAPGRITSENEGLNRVEPHERFRFGCVGISGVDKRTRELRHSTLRIGAVVNVEGSVSVVEDRSDKRSP